MIIETFMLAFSFVLGMGVAITTTCILLGIVETIYNKLKGQ